MLIIGVHGDDRLDAWLDRGDDGEATHQRGPLPAVRLETDDAIRTTCQGHARGIVRRAVIHHHDQDVRRMRPDAMHDGGNGIRSLEGRDHARRTHLSPRCRAAR